MDGDAHLRLGLVAQSDENPTSPSTSDAVNGCCSLLERYQRLKCRRLSSLQEAEGQHRPRDSEGGLASTTRTLVGDLYSGELPLYGGEPHLKSEAQEQLRQPDNFSFSLAPLDGMLGMNDYGRNWDIDLALQNQEWLETAWMKTRLGPSDIRYECSSASSDEESHASSHPVQSPFQQAMIDRESVVSEPAPPPSEASKTEDEKLVDLARNGNFADLLEALKRARMEATLNNDGSPTASSVYLDAVDTFLSEWTEYTTRDNVMIRRKHSFQTAMEHSGEHSFKTCDLWYRDESRRDPYETVISKSESQAWPDIEERQRVLRQLICERAQRMDEERQCRRKRIIVVTKIPKKAPNQ